MSRACAAARASRDRRQKKRKTRRLLRTGENTGPTSDSYWNQLVKYRIRSAADQPGRSTIEVNSATICLQRPPAPVAQPIASARAMSGSSREPRWEYTTSISDLLAIASRRCHRRARRPNVGDHLNVVSLMSQRNPLSLRTSEAEHLPSPPSKRRPPLAARHSSRSKVSCVKWSSGSCL
jgi:hypothetical protein